MYENRMLNRAISALDNAGFLITGFSCEQEEDDPSMKLKILPQVTISESYEEHKPAPAQKVYRYPGEIANLEKYLDVKDWRAALSFVRSVLRNGDPVAAFNPGDFVLVSFDVPAASHRGVEFEALQIRDARIQIVDVQEDRIIFNFDEIIFSSRLNAENKNTGGFKESALAEYLNAQFLDSLNIADVLAPNNDGQLITIPTATEVFGDEEYWSPSANYSDEPCQLDFFKSIKNRIKVLDNDTSWWWLSSPSPSALSAAHFCRCGNLGVGTHYSASAVGGVAPVFCVAAAT
jgi:hypothetical protein